MQKSCEELRAIAESKVAQFNNIYLDKENSTQKMVEDAQKEVDTAIDEYNAQSMKNAYEECAKAGDPMLAAILALTYPKIGAKAPKEKKGSDEVAKMELVDRVGKIDAYRLHKRVTGGIGKDKNWWAMIEKLNQLLTARAGLQLETAIKPEEIKASFAMKDLSRQIKLADGKKDPVGDSNIKDTLQRVVNAMVGEEYVVEDKDVVFLLNAHSKKDTKAKLTMALQNNSNFRLTIMEVCHRIAERADYEISFKAEKKK